MKMLADTVLVLEHKGKAASDGGIILPDGSKDRTYKGTVIAVGPGKPLSDGGRYKMTVRVGDVIAYPDRVGDKVKIDGQEMLAIPEQYIICVLVEADVDEPGFGSAPIPMSQEPVDVPRPMGGVRQHG